MNALANWDLSEDDKGKRKEIWLGIKNNLYDVNPPKRYFILSNNKLKEVKIEMHPSDNPRLPQGLMDRAFVVCSAHP